MSLLRSLPGILLVFLLASGQTPSSQAAAIPSAPVNPISPQPSGTALVFYAQPEMNEDLWPVLFRAVQADLGEGAGLLDRDPILVRGSQDLRGVTFPRIISVKLLGRCDVLPQASHAAEKGPLGWVLMVSGKIQPFVFINCTRIAQVLRPASFGLSQQARQYAMAQAIAHVLIHEWSHIARQSSSHGARGITQAELSLKDLSERPGNNRLTARNR
jgi:hypothetical protein